MKIYFIICSFFLAAGTFDGCRHNHIDFPKSLPPAMPRDLKREIDRVENLFWKIAPDMTVDEIKQILGRDVWGGEYQIFFSQKYVVLQRECTTINIISGGRDGIIQVDYSSGDNGALFLIGTDDIRYFPHYCNRVYGGGHEIYDYEIYQ